MSLLAELSRRERGRKLIKLWRAVYDHSRGFGPENLGPYEWQVRFVNMGAANPERMLMAANRVGKTEVAAGEIACHSTGNYPEWWSGKRFMEATRIWVVSVTNEASRDICQLALLGGEGEHGTGWLPAESIEKVSYRQAGVSNVVDTVRVRHASGGKSTITFKTHDQGRAKFQGTSQHVVWMDEEPPYDIYSECLTRTLDVNGIVLLTFTPLLGASEVVRHFTQAKAQGIGSVNVSWDDAPHLNEKEKDRLSASYADWERDTRSKGVPMLGSGAVYPIREEDIKVAPFDIPGHWPRLAAMDFGWDHPTAVAWMAWDRDADVIYIYDVFSQSKSTVAEIASAIKKRGEWILVHWPHDGMKKDPRSGRPIKDLYKDEGVRMYRESARYDDETAGSQPREPIVAEIYGRMKSGRFKVFETCRVFFEELRMYHRDDGKIVPKDDDIISAVHYAVMMRRKAQLNNVTTLKAKPKYTRPIVGGVR